MRSFFLCIVCVWVSERADDWEKRLYIKEDCIKKTHKLRRSELHLLLISFQLFHVSHISCHNLQEETRWRPLTLCLRLFSSADLLTASRLHQLFAFRLRTDTKGASPAFALLRRRNIERDTSEFTLMFGGRAEAGRQTFPPLFSVKAKASHEPPRWSTNKSHQRLSRHRTPRERIGNSLITVQTNYRDREYCGNERIDPGRGRRRIQRVSFLSPKNYQKI